MVENLFYGGLRFCGYQGDDSTNGQPMSIIVSLASHRPARDLYTNNILDDLTDNEASIRSPLTDCQITFTGKTVETSCLHTSTTLDVKHRFTKTQAALTALKTAAEDNATDHFWSYHQPL